VITQQAFRYGVSGVIATCVHVAVAALAFNFLVPSQPIANTIAFVAAMPVSYFMNALWSFGGAVHGRNFARFVVVSLVGLGLSGVIAAVAEAAGLNYWTGIACVIAIVPVVSFALHRSWTFG
jgi:putative flippase GtrA